MIHLPNPLQFLLGQYRGGQLQHGAVSRLPGKQVAVVADVDGAVGLHFFPQRVNRRVGHLCETLAEVVIQGRMGFRQRRHRHVRAHGNDRFRALRRHRQYDVLHVFPCIMECLAELFPLRFRQNILFNFSCWQVLQPDQFLHPLRIGMLLGKAGLQGLAFRQPACLQICFQHVSGFQLPAPQNMGIFFKQHACLGGQDQPPVIRQCAAQRAQAVPVQGRAHCVAVGIQDCRGAVPGLHHCGIVAVQIPPGCFFLQPLPGFRQQNHSGQRQRESVHRQELQGIIQHLAVASVRINHRQYALHFRAHHVGTHGFFTRLHPVMVAADGIDFPVMQQHPLGMRLAPGRESIGRETGVHHGHAAGIAHILQIVIEGAQLVHQHHALVDDRAAGQGAYIRVRVLVFKNTP